MADSKYSVVSLKIEELLSPSTAEFEVPPFQRAYSWGAEEINQMIDDIFDDSSDKDLPYFLGSIVLAAGEEGTDSKRNLILDGQQRLTTISLTIAVLLRKLGEAGGDERQLGRLETRLFSFEGLNPKAKIRLLNEDQQLYSLLLKDPSRHQERNHKRTQLGAGVARIYSAIERHANKEGSESGAIQVYTRMLSRLLEDVEIVKITAPSERYAFRLFETLNDRGLALSAADLIKNKLFSQCADINDVMVMWSEMVTAIQDDNVVDFLRYYWIATRDFVRKQRLYDEYRSHISKLSSTQASDLALQLLYAAEDYQRIINPGIDSKSGKDPSTSDALDRLNSYRAKSCRPAILACSSSILEHRETDRPKIVEICESITVRYSMVGEQNPSRLERIYSDMCKELRDPERTLREIFTTEPLYSHMKDIPSDDEFREKLANLSILSVTPGWRQILARLSSKIGSGETRPEGPERVHVDHILPQEPSPQALKESRLTREEALRLVPRIGNLTLLKGEWNREATNKPFSFKRREIYPRSEVAMTRELLDYEEWSQEQIEYRSRYLAEKATIIYPHPLDIVS